MKIELEYPRNSGRIYTAEPFGNCVRVTAKPGRTQYVAVAGREMAIAWLCDRSLRRSKARGLVLAATDEIPRRSSDTESASLLAVGQNGDCTPGI